jgi:diguanylate cyclase
MVGPIGTALVPMSEFGPFDALADRAHELYIDGFSEQAVRACRAWAPASTSAGDVATTRYLHYIEGIALQSVGPSSRVGDRCP